MTFSYRDNTTGQEHKAAFFIYTDWIKTGKWNGKDDCIHGFSPDNMFGVNLKEVLKSVDPSSFCTAKDDK